MVIVKAKDKDGNRLFSLSDRDNLLQNADYKVVSRIAERSKTISLVILRTSRETKARSTPPIAIISFYAAFTAIICDRGHG